MGSWSGDSNRSGNSVASTERHKTIAAVIELSEEGFLLLPLSLLSSISLYLIIFSLLSLSSLSFSLYCSLFFSRSYLVSRSCIFSLLLPARGGSTKEHSHVATVHRAKERGTKNLLLSTELSFSRNNLPVRREQVVIREETMGELSRIFGAVPSITGSQLSFSGLSSKDAGVKSLPLNSSRGLIKADAEHIHGIPIPILDPVHSHVESSSRKRKRETTNSTGLATGGAIAVGKSNSWKKGKSETPYGSKFLVFHCFNCDQEGHKIGDCKAPKDPATIKKNIERWRKERVLVQAGKKVPYARVLMAPTNSKKRRSGTSSGTKRKYVNELTNSLVKRHKTSVAAVAESSEVVMAEKPKPVVDETIEIETVKLVNIPPFLTDNVSVASLELQCSFSKSEYHLEDNFGPVLSLEVGTPFLVLLSGMGQMRSLLHQFTDLPFVTLSSRGGSPQLSRMIRAMDATGLIMCCGHPTYPGKQCYLLPTIARTGDSLQLIFTNIGSTRALHGYQTCLAAQKLPLVINVTGILKL